MESILIKPLNRDKENAYDVLITRQFPILALSCLLLERVIWDRKRLIRDATDVWMRWKNALKAKVEIGDFSKVLKA